MIFSFLEENSIKIKIRLYNHLPLATQDYNEGPLGRVAESFRSQALKKNILANAEKKSFIICHGLQWRQAEKL
jgi:hypothetical protein